MIRGPVDLAAECLEGTLHGISEKSTLSFSHLLLLLSSWNPKVLDCGEISASALSIYCFMRRQSGCCSPTRIKLEFKVAQNDQYCRYLRWNYNARQNCLEQGSCSSALTTSPMQCWNFLVSLTPKNQATSIVESMGSLIPLLTPTFEKFHEKYAKNTVFWSTDTFITTRILLFIPFRNFCIRSRRATAFLLRSTAWYIALHSIHKCNINVTSNYW